MKIECIHVRIFVGSDLDIFIDRSLTNVAGSYKNNYRSECIPEGNTRTKVIIFCKSRPSNWQLKRI